ncbi:MAG: molybdenum ABC transporter ATP-binding protein [Rhizobiales bacterium]|nr:molybdenum ABC transporter ATP-binding protein [Hyphomicrobiales bacterium]
MALSVAVTKKLERGFALSAEFTSSGRLTALFGRSGAGKTTLVNLIAGLLRPDSGRIAIDDLVLFDKAAGIDLPASRRRIGYVFQEDRLFPHMSVRSNLLYGRHLTPVDRQWGSLDQVVDLLGIGHLLKRRPAALSGGEKQRVAIGRALLASPRLLLMDEPLASLDQQRKEEILPYIERLRDEMQLPIVYVSHAIEEIARIADTIVVLGKGNVVAVGPVGEILARADLRPYTGQAEASAVLTARVAAQDERAGITTLDHPAGRLTVAHVPVPVEAVVRFRIRARDVALAVGYPGLISIRNRLAGTITAIHDIEPPGVEVHLDVGGEHLVAAITRDATHALELTVGQPVTALVKSAALDRFSFAAEPSPQARQPA